MGTVTVKERYESMNLNKQNFEKEIEKYIVSWVFIPEEMRDIFASFTCRKEKENIYREVQVLRTNSTFLTDFQVPKVNLLLNISYRIILLQYTWRLKRCVV